MSFDVYEKYKEAYLNTPISAGANDDYNNYLPLSSRQCQIVPIAAMGTSQRVFITPSENIWIGYDIAEDFDTLRVEVNHRALDIMMDMKIGVNFAALSMNNIDYVIANDQT